MRRTGNRDPPVIGRHRRPAGPREDASRSVAARRDLAAVHRFGVALLRLRVDAVGRQDERADRAGGVRVAMGGDRSHVDRRRLAAAVDPHPHAGRARSAGGRRAAQLDAHVAAPAGISEVQAVPEGVVRVFRPEVVGSLHDVFPGAGLKIANASRPGDLDHHVRVGNGVRQRKTRRQRDHGVSVVLRARHPVVDVRSGRSGGENSGFAIVAASNGAAAVLRKGRGRKSQQKSRGPAQRDELQISWGARIRDQIFATKLDHDIPLCSGGFSCCDGGVRRTSVFLPDDACTGSGAH